MWENCIYRNLSRIFSVFFVVAGGSDQGVGMEWLVDEERLARLKLVSVDLSLVWFRRD